jgi:outer membrane receptor protein involved in Fe transport
VHGIVVDVLGRTVPGALVSIAGSSAPEPRATDQAGAFTIEGLTPGRYQIRAELADLGTDTRDIEVDTSDLVLTLVLRPSYVETVVVSASRGAQTLLSAPATVTVVSAREIRAHPGDDFAHLLEGSPGLNVSRLNARDISFDFRTAGGVLSNSQLVLVDGRSVNQEGLGNVFWDLFPVSFEDIEQIELIATPGSAVWGANALSGVINVRTKAPRTDPGGTATIGGGSIGTRLARGRWAQVNGRLSYRISAGFYEQDAWQRDSTLPDGTPLPLTAVFDNVGTKQTRADLRVDWEPSAGRVWSGTVGFADSTGIIHTGSGPYKWADQGSYALYGGLDYTTDPLEAKLYWHRLRGDTTSLLFGNTFYATTDTIAADVIRRRALGTRQSLSVGGSARVNLYNLTLAPDDSFRSALGAFVEDQITLTPRLTWSAGVRVDKYDSFDTAVSPRSSLVFRPTPRQAVRIAFNRAFRAPSLLETFAEADFVNVIPLLPGLPPVTFSTQVAGNRGVRPEVMRAIEAGYTVAIGRRASASVTVYQNSVKDKIRLAQVESYGPQLPPPGWPLPPAFVPPLPKTLTYLNVGTVRDRGLELTGRAEWTQGVSTRASYVLQADTKATETDPNFPLQLNRPPRQRATLSVVYEQARIRGSLNLIYSGSAYWSDVLDPRFWGTTASYMMVNGLVAVPIGHESLELVIGGVNLANRPIKQHVFGDVLRRQVTAELRVKW